MTSKRENDRAHEISNLIGGRNGSVSLSQKCSATSKRTGKRCGAWALRGAKTCRVHGSATKKSKIAAAKRIAEASGYAADMLVEFMADPLNDMKMRTQIAQDLLNRAGFSGKTELAVELQEPAWLAHMNAVIVDYSVAPRDEVVEDAVVVPPTAALTVGPGADEDDDAARALEARRAQRKKKSGRAFTLPSEDVARPAPAQGAAPAQPDEDAVPAWYKESPLGERTGLRPIRPRPSQS